MLEVKHDPSQTTREQGMSHRPGNKDCPLHPDGPKIISFDKPECTCKPTAADRLEEMAEDIVYFCEPDCDLLRNAAELVRACISDRALTHDDSCGFNEYQWCDCATGKASEKRIQAALANLQGSNKE